MKTTETIGLDTNILLYGDDPGSPHYASAKQVMDSVFNGTFHACISHQVLAEYFSVATSSPRLKLPLSSKEASDRILFLEKTRKLKKIYPKRSTLKRAIQVCAGLNIRGPKIFDIIYGMTLLDNNIHKLLTNNTKDFSLLEGLHSLSLEDFAA